MSINFNRARIGITMMALLSGFCSHTVLATPSAMVVRQGDNEQITLTVTSSCGPASIKIKKNVLLTTPFSVTFPRGKTIKSPDRSRNHV